MDFLETEIKARELASKGKADFFIRDTLLKSGADPQDVKTIMQNFLDEKNKRAFRDKMVGLLGIILGIVWIWATFSFDFLREFIWDHETRRIGGFMRLIIVFGPFGYGVLMLIKGVFKLKKLI
jgi:hypothetical protein